jgi:hypothetical protein
MRLFIGVLISALVMSCGSKMVSKNNQNPLQNVVHEPESVDKNTVSKDSLERLNDEYFSYDEAYPVNTTVHFKEFSLEILSYQVQNELEELTTISGDTIELSEWVGSNLMNRKINIKTHKDWTFEVDYRLNDMIYEQYDHRITYEKDKKWHKWEGSTPYKNIKTNHNSFTFPNIDLANGYLEFRKKQLNLRDTFVDLSGESDNIATVVYKEKASIYDVENVFIRITATDSKKQKRVKYLKIYLSKGC